jgi:hypothetical protein
MCQTNSVLLGLVEQLKLEDLHIEEAIITFSLSYYEFGLMVMCATFSLLAIRRYRRQQIVPKELILFSCGLMMLILLRVVYILTSYIKLTHTVMSLFVHINSIANVLSWGFILASSICVFIKAGKANMGQESLIFSGADDQINRQDGNDRKD